MHRRMIAIMSEWRSLFDGAPSRMLAPGETVFAREQPVRSIYMVVTGTVALERPMADGTALTLYLAREGALLAEASLFADCYHCDAVARETARVAMLPKSSLLAALRAAPDMAIDMFAQAAHEVQRQRSRIEILRLRRVSDRLDAWLELYGEPSRGEWTRVADGIGVTPPALYRELSRRRKE